jgi:hypothetical protein
MASLINQSAVKKYLLDSAKRLRPGWECKQISKEAIDYINYKTRLYCDNLVKAHPTKGKTLKIK